MSTSRHREIGVTLVELIVFIVLVGVAMAGLFAAFNTITAASSAPQVRKQALAIAESLLEEVELMPFTYCDPDDANAATAVNSTVGAGGCATLSENTTIGPEANESRYPDFVTTTPFDNVSDYSGFSMTGIKDISGSAIAGLESYSASVTVSRAGTALGLALDEQALQISVTVSAPGVSVTLEGYRTRYAPNTLP